MFIIGENIISGLLCKDSLEREINATLELNRAKSVI